MRPTAWPPPVEMGPNRAASLAVRRVRCFLMAMCAAGCTADFGPLPASSYDDPRIDSAFVTEELDYFRDRARVPAVSVCLVEAGHVVWCNAVGMADADAQRSVQEDTVFLLASVSKPVTATLVMQQRDAGHFELDSAADDILPFPARHPDGALTVMDLLTHHGAIADADVLDTFYMDGADPTLSLRTVVEGYFTPGGTYYDAQDNFWPWAPGEEFEYSNMGFALAGYIAEHAAGQDLAVASQESLFRPLAMERTSWRLGDFTEDELARPHTAPNRPVEHYTFADYPNGGLRSSAPDLARWVAALLADGTLDGQTVLAPDSVSEMLRRHADDGDAGTALGWFLDDSGDGNWRMHDGGEVGVTTAVGVNPERGVGFVLLTNGDARNGPFLDLQDLLVELAEDL